MFPKKKEKTKEEPQQALSTNSGQATPQEQSKTELPAQDIQELQKQIEALRKEKDDIFAKLQRVAADYDNYQKRSSKQITDSVNYEKDKIVKSLLPVLDNFDYILTNTSCGVTDETLLKGVKIIYDQMLDVLKGHGIEQIKSAGEPFNPAHHEAITHRSENDKEEGLVLEELQKGYKLSGRLIRASRVVVNKLPSSQTPPPPEEPETKDTQ
ncbi:MAG: nucleotide exchange factor GrpE [Sedimentisphaerales bacterium]|jgi:molecular chaperone GrpE